MSDIPCQSRETKREGLKGGCVTHCIFVRKPDLWKSMSGWRSCCSYHPLHVCAEGSLPQACFTFPSSLMGVYCFFLFQRRWFTRCDKRKSRSPRVLRTVPYMLHECADRKAIEITNEFLDETCSSWILLSLLASCLLYLACPLTCITVREGCGRAHCSQSLTGSQIKYIIYNFYPDNIAFRSENTKS